MQHILLVPLQVMTLQYAKSMGFEILVRWAVATVECNNPRGHAKPMHMQNFVALLRSWTALNKNKILAYDFLTCLTTETSHDAIIHYARGDTKLILHSFQHGLPLVSITLREPLLREGWRCVYNTYLQATYIGHVPRWPSACFPKLI